MSRNRKLSRGVEGFTFGLINTAVDLAVFTTALGIFGILASGHRKGLAASIDGAIEIAQEFKKFRIKRGILYAKKKGYLSEEEAKEAVLTEMGRKRLAELLPKRRKQRLWDQKLYLITYDIPEELRATRNYLRDYLKSLGCGMFQASVWLSPFDPTLAVKEFVKEYRLEGYVFVASIGKDGNIGKMPINELLEKVFRLRLLNARYLEFIQKVRDKKYDVLQTYFAYLTILKDDPQLPDELLPKDWQGEKAYQLFYKAVELSPCLLELLEG